MMLGWQIVAVVWAVTFAYCFNLWLGKPLVAKQASDLVKLKGELESLKSDVMASKVKIETLEYKTR